MRPTARHSGDASSQRGHEHAATGLMTCSAEVLTVVATMVSETAGHEMTRLLAGYVLIDCRHIP